MALPINGSVLKSQLDWLNEHAHMGPSGMLEHKESGRPIHSRVEHRYRLNQSGASAPFVAEKLLNGFGAGGMISFTVFWCEGADVPAASDEVRRSEVIMLRGGLPQ